VLGEHGIDGRRALEGEGVDALVDVVTSFQK
jgi:hypothetical protein